ncbi:MAG: cupin domain-containing protein [Alphaproteobacteria bacterium]|nr:cupin domain-containing protein [Alphaproteobacteria bacterium]
MSPEDPHVPSTPSTVAQAGDHPRGRDERLALLDDLLGNGLHDDDHDLGELLAELAGDLPPVTPSEAARTRLHDAVAALPHAPLAPALADLLQVGLDRARSYLARLTDPSIWTEMIPGAWVHHLEGGPDTAAAEVGFVRVAPHTPFPVHRHVGEERNLVLDGALYHADGQRVGAGARFDLPPGGTHAFHTRDEPVVFAVVVWGVAFDGVEIRRT